MVVDNATDISPSTRRVAEPLPDPGVLAVHELQLPADAGGHPAQRYLLSALQRIDSWIVSFRTFSAAYPAGLFRGRSTPRNVSILQRDRRRGKIRRIPKPGNALMGAAIRLHQVTGDRDNNFNLLRLGAAAMVILGHSILLSGDLDNGMGWALGYGAVNCFFVISGFLVCRSLLGRKSLGSYLAARALRIYPALLAAVLLCVFVLGLWMTPMDSATFLEHEVTRRFLWFNSLLIAGPVEVHLPTLFPDSPFPGQVNVPLWTLQYELAMYLLLALVYLLARALPAGRGHTFLCLAVTASALFCFAAFLANVASSDPRIGILPNGVRFGAMFFTGASLYLWRRHVRLSHGTAILLCAIVLATGPWRPLFVVASWLSLPYLLLYLAYVPGGLIRSFNRLGDYSYGLYILAFPVQQLLVWYWPMIGPLTLFLAAMALTLPLAMLSWHAIERPMLSVKPTPPDYGSRASTIR